MPSAHAAVVASGHLARRSALFASGIRREQLESALRDGELWRPLRGWYATGQADAEQIRAIRVGAPIGCVSALRRLGVWSGADDRLHLHARQTSSRLADAARGEGTVRRNPHPRLDPLLARTMAIRPCDDGPVLIHWQRPLDPARASGWIVSAVDAVAQAVTCQDEEHALACLDSALHEGVISRSECDRILRTLTGPIAGLGALVDPRADSGNESIVRLRLQRLGHRVEPQAALLGGGFADLLVDGLVVVEVDSEAHHSSADQRRTDRGRTLLSASLGQPTIRIGPEHLTEPEWPLVVAALRQQLDDTRLLLRSGRLLARAR